jgi:hypothetical protein
MSRNNAYGYSSSESNSEFGDITVTGTATVNTLDVQANEIVHGDLTVIGNINGNITDPIINCQTLTATTSVTTPLITNPALINITQDVNAQSIQATALVSPILTSGTGNILMTSNMGGFGLGQISQMTNVQTDGLSSVANHLTCTTPIVMNATPYLHNMMIMNKNIVADDSIGFVLQDQGVNVMEIGRDTLGGGGTEYIWNNTNSDLYFGTNNTERMRLMAGGGMHLPGTLDMLSNAIQGATTITTTNLNVDAITNTGTEITCGRPIEFLNGAGTPVTGAKLAFYSPPSSYQYYGIYIAGSTFGFIVDQTATNYLFSAATGAATKRDSFAVLGNGGVLHYDVALAPSAFAGIVDEYSQAGILKTKNSSGVVVSLSEPAYIGALYSAGSAVAVGTTAALTDWYAIPLTSYNLSAQSNKFSNASVSYNVMQYTGTPTRTLKFVISATLASTVTATTLGITLYKNPTVNGANLVTAGTALTYHTYTRIGTAGVQHGIEVNGLTSCATNDTFVVCFSSSAIANVTCSDLNFVLEAVSAGTD